MKQLLEFLPLVLFFSAYQLSGETLNIGSWSHTFDGIFSATAVLMVSSVLVWLVSSMISKANDKRLMWMTFFGEKNLLQRLMGQQLTLPQRIWGYLNALWIANFTLVGTLNIVVAYRFEEAFWVSYKLYSSVGFTLLLMLLTMFLVLPYLKEQDAGDGDDAGSMRGSS